MKERPILFSAPMVRALLDGSKTQTRRPINAKRTNYQSIEEREDGALWPWREDLDNACDYWYPSPYGQPGDRLWVRETHLNWWKIDPLNTVGPRIFSHVAAFAADGYKLEPGEKWIPSIHMLREASRINLEIVAVRVERLQDISEADAIAEGCSGHRASDGYDIDPFHDVDPIQEYRELWESINGPGSWESNPWVWVVEFRRSVTQEAQ